ncbi:MAG TPA: hypothetical protein VL463_13595 [Kofleriaceae bacterium]|nr:hypothetical protein [Kofleriaceae bacterium]
MIGALLVSGGVAHADAGAEVSIGGGVHAGEATSAFDARASWEHSDGGAAIGLGVRVRAIGDAIVTRDWDDAHDWLAIVRYLALRRDDGSFELAAGVQPIVTLGDGALAERVIPAVILDRRATGAHVRARTRAWRFDAVIDDVVAPEVIGTRAQWIRDDDERASVAIDLASDPLARFGATSVSAALTTRDRNVIDRIEAGARIETTADAGVWIAATTAAAWSDARFVLRGEATLGAPPPFGPLYALERDLMKVPEHGLGGAVRLDLDALGVHVDGSMRARPAQGAIFDARVAAPAYRDVQLAAIVAGNPSHHLYVGGGELRVRASTNAFVGIEAARQIDDASARAAWQATAWLGYGI